MAATYLSMYFLIIIPSLSDYFKKEDLHNRWILTPVLTSTLKYFINTIFPIVIIVFI